MRSECRQAEEDSSMFMPFSSRILYTLVGITMPVGSFWADYNDTHIFNPNWPPHAKFHDGQTLSMSILLGLMTILFAWKKTKDQTSAVVAASGFAAVYWISQGAAILYPGTAFFDPQFVTPNSFPFGIALQVYIEIAHLALIALASWLALRRGVRWSGWRTAESIS
jgi:uncharacterized protein DUF6640